MSERDIVAEARAYSRDMKAQLQRLDEILMDPHPGLWTWRCQLEERFKLIQEASEWSY